jgi:phosphatidylglycerol---prolipoprotein diacylglyceryl transferase
MFVIAFPDIHPVAIEIGPLAIRWYALAYIAGIVLGWRYALYLVGRPPVFMTRQDMDDFILWLTLGIILGGRLGYVLFYKPGYYLDNPLEALALWHGGMSFHGGLIGVLLAVYLFARKRGFSGLALGDIVATVTPIGLFFGRIANFINGELYGRISDVPWAMVFPGPEAGPLPRHPSQLYEALSEGLVLLALMTVVAHRPEIRERPGRVGGIFLIGYSIARLASELFREPDAHLGFILGPVTMGQILSLPMMLVGLALVWQSSRIPKLPHAVPKAG